MEPTLSFEDLYRRHAADLYRFAYWLSGSKAELLPAVRAGTASADSLALVERYLAQSLELAIGALIWLGFLKLLGGL